MKLFKVVVMMTFLAMCSAHAGNFPAVQAFECPAVQEYQRCIAFAPDFLPTLEEQSTANDAMVFIIENVQGWWAAFLGVTEDELQETDQMTDFINTSLPSDTPIDPCCDDYDEKDFDFNIWIPGDQELSPVIISTQMPNCDLEMNPPLVYEIPDDDELTMDELDHDKHFRIPANLTYDVIDDAMPFQPLTYWHTISALVDWFLTQLLINTAASARLQIEFQSPYFGTMPMMTSPVTSTPRDFFTMDLRGQIRPGEVPIEKPPPPAWATRTVCLAFVFVCLCLLSPVCFTGDEQKEKARLAKAFKSRRGNDHRRSGRRYAAYMNARGRQ